MSVSGGETSLEEVNHWWAPLEGTSPFLWLLSCASASWMPGGEQHFSAMPIPCDISVLEPEDHAVKPLKL